MAQKMILVSCSDGRITGAAVRARAIASKHGFDIGEKCVYRIKVPGPDGVVTGKRGLIHKDSLREDLAVLIEKTHAAVIGIAGHCDCAGHPVSEEEHEKDVQASATIIQSWFPNTPVISLLDRPQEDESWAYHEECYCECVK